MRAADRIRRDGGGRNRPCGGVLASPEALVITGPTAAGKTRLAIEVARHLGAELIAMDSRQVYRGLDIGTAKPSLADRARVPHHGLDLVDPSGYYSAGRFARDARRWIAEIRARGRVPVLVGGTGFFLRALTDPIFEEPELDAERRAALRRFLAARTRGELERWVHVLDPGRMEVAAVGGRQRLGRAIEVAVLSGRPLGWWHRHARAVVPPLRAVIVVLVLPRTALYERIDRRAAEMLESGLVDEVRRLLRAGYDEGSPGLGATGYREVIACVRGAMSREEALARMQRATRRYARRQMTWFRHQLPRDALRLDARAPLQELVERCVAAWRQAAEQSARSPASETCTKQNGTEVSDTP